VLELLVDDGHHRGIRLVDGIRHDLLHRRATVNDGAIATLKLGHPVLANQRDIVLPGGEVGHAVLVGLATKASGGRLV